MKNQAPNLLEVMDKYFQTTPKKEETIQIWKNAPAVFYKFLNGSNQVKGKIGVDLFLTIMAYLGVKGKIISDKGDLVLESFILESSELSELNWLLGKVGEGKTSKNLDVHIANNVQKKQAWFNQIRRLVQEWKYLVLVLVCPIEGFSVYLVSREEYFSLKEEHPNLITEEGHKGTEELDQIKLVKNSSQDQFTVLEPFLIYRGFGTPNDLEKNKDFILEKLIAFCQRNDKKEVQTKDLAA